MAKRLHTRRFQLGTCYYPEQWPETFWDEDFRQMHHLGFSIVRMAEFAWTLFEPVEGVFDFRFFDHVMDLAHQHGLQVILGTPTATPPAWLTATYPETLNVSQTGIVYHHGMRRHVTYNAPIYRELCQRIVKQLAAHYCEHPALAGWQIDNELNCEINVFYAEADQHAFRAWLQARYGSLERLNAAWGTVFWNQTYTDWHQVFLTRPTPANAPNPHQALDEKRFISDATTGFAKMQAEAIRAFDTSHWITTNGLFPHLDSHQMTAEALDFIAYDSYPQIVQFSSALSARESLRDRDASWHLSIARGISPNFCITEQQSGASSWPDRMERPAPRPGQMRLWTYQSIAHGADMLLYFRWRTATFGTEIYWHGLHNYDNRPNRRVAEAAQVGRELAALGAVIVGSTYQANIAIVKDYANDWDGELDNWHGPYEHESTLAWFTALQHAHIPVDVVYLQPTTSVADLAHYRCLIYAHPTILTEDTTAQLRAYVQQGGTLIFGCRTGYKDTFGHCLMQPMPGPVADLCGISVTDFTRVAPTQPAPTLHWLAGQDEASVTLKAEGFNDILQVEAESVQVIACYGDDAGYYAGEPALTQNTWREGTVYYYGAVFTVAMAQAMIRHLALTGPIADLCTLPSQIEVAIREGREGNRVIFLLNYADTPQLIHMHQTTTNLLNGATLTGQVTMAPYDVYVLGDAHVFAQSIAQR